MTDSMRWWVLVMIGIGCGLVYLLAPVLTPFLVAMLLTYLLIPIVQRLRRFHVPSTLAVLLVLFLLILLIFGFFLLFIPLLQSQIGYFVNRLPEINAWVLKEFLPWLDAHFHIQASLNLEGVVQMVMTHLQDSAQIASKFIKVLMHSGFAIAAVVTNLVLIPVAMFYFMRDWSLMIDAASELLPRDSKATVVRLVHESGEVLSAFLRGQLLVMFALGIIYSAGLWLVGLELGVLIGLLAGLVSIVPYLGFATGIVLALLAGFFQFHDAMHLVLIAVVFGVGEMAESFVLIPCLVGDRVGLHPVVVIFSVLAGGKLFGFVGVLLAVPVSAVVMVFLRHLYGRYVRTRYYLGETMEQLVEKDMLEEEV